MKKQIIAVVFAAIAVLGLTACNRTTDTDNNDTKTETETKTENYITEDEAKTKALAHAELEGKEVTYTRVNQDTKDGQEVYEVEYTYEDKQYAYVVNALTGEIISHENEADTSANAGNDIGEEAARALILEKAQGAEDKDIVIERNTNDGQAIYKGTVVHEGKTYEYEIDAVNGTITKWE
ncbi:MAG: PepSY domain-containing protein [Lachnospiraceae bacterium]